MRLVIRRKYGIALAVMLLIAAVAVPATAEAEVLEYQLQFLPVGSGGVSQLIVNLILDPATELPATVQVPLPEGANVTWTGEIVGDDPTQDPYRESTVTAVSGGRVVEFVMSEAYVAQVEADLPAPTTSGTKVSSAMVWVNTGEEAPLYPSVRLESGAGDVDISPDPVGDPQTNEDGETLYSLSSVTLATGETFQIAVDYTLGGAASSAGTNVALVVAGVLLLVAVVALVIVVSRGRGRRSGPSAESLKSNSTVDEDEELTF